MAKKKRGKKVKLVTDVASSKVSIVIPMWNGLDMNQRLLESIRRFVSLPYKLFLVDDGTTDGTGEWLDTLAAANPQRIKVIHMPGNQGFVQATNAGIAAAKGEGHLLLLNNDTQFLRPGTIEMMVHALESSPDLGAVGPVTDFAMGPQQMTMNNVYPEFHMARFLIGFCILVKNGVWQKVGPLDAQFNHLCNDDLDYSLRIREAGFKLGVCRSAFIHHLGGASFQELFGPNPYQTPQWQEKDRQGRSLLVQKWGQEKVDELFLPVDFSGMRVLVSVPAWASIYPEAYANHMGTFMDEMKKAEKTGLQLEFAPLIRSAICCARNELVRTALRRECTHLFFMDDDMLMPEGAIHKLLARNVDVVSGLCHLRTPPHFPSMFIDPDHSTGKIFYIRDWPEGQMIQVDNIGSACVLIRTEVFKKIMTMEFPGDDGNVVKAKGEDLWYLYGKARPGEHTVGEDVFFCKLARDAGYKIWVDTSVQFGHIGPPQIYDTNYFKNVKAQDNGQFPGLSYTSYEAARDLASRSDGLLTPEKLASRMGGDTGERADLFKRLYAGVIGDGKHPGSVSAAGNRGKRIGGSPV